MSLMAGEDLPAFHDFLGLSWREDMDERDRDPIMSEIARTCKKDKNYDGAAGISTLLASVSCGQLDASSTAIDAAGSLPLTFMASLVPDSGNFWWRNTNIQPHGKNIGGAFSKPECDGIPWKKRDSFDSRNSLQDTNQMNTEALASCSMKVPRVEGQVARKGMYQTSSTDDLHLTMQPPRPASNGPAILCSVALKTDFPSNSEMSNCSGQAYMNPGMLKQAQNSYAGLHTNQVAGNLRENAILTSQILLQPGDEGSHTGLKCRNIMSLVNNDSATPPAQVPVCAVQDPAKSKLWRHSTGMDYQSIGTARRQLTIFYGGQAHVFDDVPPEKAEAIMALSGSSGRSWSTTYSCRSRGSLASSGNEPLVSEREKERTISRDGAINGFSSLASTSNLHIARVSPANTGSAGDLIGHLDVPEGNLSHLSQPVTSIHSETERQDSAQQL